MTHTYLHDERGRCMTHACSCTGTYTAASTCLPSCRLVDHSHALRDLAFAQRAPPARRCATCERTKLCHLAFGGKPGGGVAAAVQRKHETQQWQAGQARASQVSRRERVRVCGAFAHDLLCRSCLPILNVTTSPAWLRPAQLRQAGDRTTVAGGLPALGPCAVPYATAPTRCQPVSGVGAWTSAQRSRL